MKQQAAQVYFSLPAYLELKSIAASHGKPFATWARDVLAQEAVKENLQKKSLADMPSSSWGGDDPYLSEHIDEILYDNP